MELLVDWIWRAARTPCCAREGELFGRNHHGPMLTERSPRCQYAVLGGFEGRRPNFFNGGGMRGEIKNFYPNCRPFKYTDLSRRNGLPMEVVGAILQNIEELPLFYFSNPALSESLQESQQLVWCDIAQKCALAKWPRLLAIDHNA